jgi:glucan biosynthesis protein C
VTACTESVIVVAMCFWLLDVFRRRFNRWGRLMRRMSEGAYAAFLLHQLILVGLVLTIRQVAWPPEAEYLITSVLGVGASFALGSLVARVPGVGRFA